MVTEAAPVAETLIPPAETPVEATTPITGAPPVADVIPESPAPAAPSVPPPPVAPFQPSLEQRVEQFAQQRNQELRAREQQVQQQENAQTLAAYQGQLANTIAEELVAEFGTEFGITPEQAMPYAKKLAQQQAQAVYQSYQRQVAAVEGMQAYQAKLQVATIISQQAGVPLESLMSYTSPDAMVEATRQIKEVADLKAQVAKLTKGSVPAQNFGTGAVGAGGAGLNEQALEKAVASGQIAMTPEISARLNKYWAQ